MLYRILDGRYSRRRPTWCSVNVADRQELIERIGAQNCSKLLGDTLTIHCNWSDWRQPLKWAEIGRKSPSLSRESTRPRNPSDNSP
jgi:hypothetical protein